LRTELYNCLILLPGSLSRVRRKMIGDYRFKWNRKVMLGRFSAVPNSPEIYQVSIYRQIDHVAETFEKETNDLPHLEMTAESVDVPVDIEKELVYAISLSFYQRVSVWTYYRRGISNIFGVDGSEVDFPMNFYTEEGGLVSSRPGHALDMAHDIAQFQLTLTENIKNSLVATGGIRSFVCHQYCERFQFSALKNSAMREANRLNDPDSVVVSEPIVTHRTIKIYNGHNDMYEVRPNSRFLELTISRCQALYPFLGDFFAVFPIVPKTDVNGPYTLSKFAHLKALTIRYDLWTKKLSVILFQSIEKSSFNTVIVFYYHSAQ